MSIRARLQALRESPSRGVRDEIEITKLENEMGAMKDLAYDIEQLYIEGHSPKTIAKIVGCSVETVLEWIESVNCEWEEAFPEEDASPFGTINS
jgi:transposase-like protein